MLLELDHTPSASDMLAAPGGSQAAVVGENAQLRARLMEVTAQHQWALDAVIQGKDADSAELSRSLRCRLPRCRWRCLCRVCVHVSPCAHLGMGACLWCVKRCACGRYCVHRGLSRGSWGCDSTPQSDGQAADEREVKEPNTGAEIFVQHMHLPARLCCARLHWGSVVLDLSAAL